MKGCEHSTSSPSALFEHPTQSRRVALRGVLCLLSGRSPSEAHHKGLSFEIALQIGSEQPSGFSGGNPCSVQSASLYVVVVDTMTKTGIPPIPLRQRLVIIANMGLAY